MHCSQFITLSLTIPPITMNDITLSTIHACLDNIVAIEDTFLRLLFIQVLLGVIVMQYLCPTLVKHKDIHLQRKKHKSQDNHIEVA